MFGDIVYLGESPCFKIEQHGVVTIYVYKFNEKTKKSSHVNLFCTCKGILRSMIKYPQPKKSDN
jgi:hypothetical protein